MKKLNATKIVLVLATLFILMACEKTHETSETVNSGDNSGSDLTAAVNPAETADNGDKPGSDIVSAVNPIYSISGTVSGDAKEAVTMTLSGAVSSITKTSEEGTYTFTRLAKGNYTVTPTLTGSTFSPASTPVQIDGVNVTEVNFLCICKDEDQDGMCD